MFLVGLQVRRKWQPTPVFLPGESHGQRNLVGYRPWGCKESDTTERLHTHTHTHTQVRKYSVVNEDSGVSCFDPEMSEC